MNERGESVRENKSTALNFYKDTVTRGNLSCWANIGELYLDTNISNAKKLIKNI